MRCLKYTFIFSTREYRDDGQNRKLVAVRRTPMSNPSRLIRSCYRCYLQTRSDHLSNPHPKDTFCVLFVLHMQRLPIPRCCNPQRRHQDTDTMFLNNEHLFFAGINIYKTCRNNITWYYSFATQILSDNSYDRMLHFTDWNCGTIKQIYTQVEYFISYERGDRNTDR